jgi:hypothetical protein
MKEEDEKQALECADLSALWSAATCRSFGGVPH